ncbi:MAG: CDP-alcohol phosphatidyltransferase family protein [Leptospiraceae bacterium]|jgi:cardiolipin synthase|nr:CDP-alcohol phosphatidyltransferase family protein [Leptospiraceae bacterium]MCZ8346090.1 CDP-alcohol phosphatidyltransferase family protein [Leptospiraceae bacterium]
MNGKEIFLIPNIITLSRVFFLLPSIYYLSNNQILYASFFLVWVFISDFFDGFLARKLNQTSFIGAILDPICDKLVVLALFSYFFLQEMVPAYYYILILTRDIAQLLSVPILLFWKKIAFKVKPKLIPKWGTALNFIILAFLALPLLPFWTQLAFPFFNTLLTLLILVSSFVEVSILVTYIPRFIQIYKGTHDTFE